MSQAVGRVSVLGCGTGAGDSGAADATTPLSAWLSSSLLLPGPTWQIQPVLPKAAFQAGVVVSRCFSLAFLHNGLCSAAGKMSCTAYEDQGISELFQLTKCSRSPHLGGFPSWPGLYLPLASPPAALGALTALLRPGCQWQ